MTIIKSITAIIVLSFSLNAFNPIILAEESSKESAANNTAFNVVQELFAAMSALDYQKMRDVVTKDFQLLENGEPWDIERLIEAIKPDTETYVRRNYFKPIKEVKKDGLVWVSYWNKATFKSVKNENTAVWLESAVMVEEDGQWKMQMMHSTYLEEKKRPKDIQYVEYIQ